MLKQPDTAYCQHNHRDCIEETLSAAKTLCHKENVRLTPLREHVLTIVLGSHKPVGAYTVLEKLGDLADYANRKPAPPTVYRALDFLQLHGLVHKIATLNAYFPCYSPEQTHQSYFLICRICETTVEQDANFLLNSLSKHHQKLGFKVEQTNVEINGLCQNCQHTEK